MRDGRVKTLPAEEGVPAAELELRSMGRRHALGARWNGRGLRWGGRRRGTGGGRTAGDSWSVWGWEAGRRPAAAEASRAAAGRVLIMSREEHVGLESLSISQSRGENVSINYQLHGGI
jgi:hypothetical protein